MTMETLENNFKMNVAKPNVVLTMSILFFIFGFVTWLNGPVMQFLKIACQLKTDVQTLFVTFAFYMGYFFLAIPFARIVQFIGYRNGMSLGLLVMALGSINFIPAAKDRNFDLFLSALCIQGAGVALLQSACITYISSTANSENLAKRIGLMCLCNKAAGIAGALIFSTLLLQNISPLEQKISEANSNVIYESLLNSFCHKIITPYIILAAVLLFMASLIQITSLPEINTKFNTRIAKPEKYEIHSRNSICQVRHLMLGALCMFLYAGVEVMAGNAVAVFGHSIGISDSQTKYFTTLTLSTMLLGGIAGILIIPKIISLEKTLKYSAIGGIILTICIYFTSGYTAISFIILLGLANAVIWPAIFQLATAELGKFIKNGIAVLIMGISGGAVLPLIYALLKEKFGLSNQFAFLLCVVPSYLFILYYAITGHIIKIYHSKTESTNFSPDFNGDAILQ